MSYPTHNDVVSPQTTGTYNPNLEPQQNGYQPSPISSPAPVYNELQTENNEKISHANADAQYPMATPQQEYYNNAAPKQGVPLEQGPPAQTSKNQYQYGTPLASLQQGTAPVDCPVCGVRELTRTEYVTGGTTHLSAALCCCILCLGCIPYLASWFKDVEHKCGHCGALLAVWHRSGRTEVIAHARA